MTQNLILIGFMGCGKSCLGTKLAKVFHMSFMDTDQMLTEEFGCSISEFFEKESEEKFRERETALLKHLEKNLKNTVLSTGGGMPLRTENAELLKKIGKVIYLKASEETTYERLKGDTTRPLLACENPKQRIHDLLQQRVPLYTKAAHVIVETDGKSFYELIREVEQIVKS